MVKIPEPNFEKIVIEKLPIAVQERVAMEVAAKLAKEFPSVTHHMGVLESRLIDSVTYTFYSFLNNIKTQNKAKATLYKYPATPWDFIKDKYAPTWFLKRWPVEYVTEEVVTWCEKNYMCPHMVFPDNYPHVMWMMKGIRGNLPDSEPLDRGV